MISSPVQLQAARRIDHAGILKKYTLLLAIAVASAIPTSALANPFSFSQDWSDTNQISINDDWSGKANIVGYRGDRDPSLTTGTDPQTVLSDDIPANTGVAGSPVVDVNANRGDPGFFISGGVSEFGSIPNPVVALQGSGTADSPYLQLTFSTTGTDLVTVSYLLRDIDPSLDDAVQQVAAHYRVGNSGPWTNIPTAYVADATTGPSLAVLVTPVSFALPNDALNQPLVQVRIITTNAPSNDEWVGVDDILVTGTSSLPLVSIDDVTQLEGTDGTTDFIFQVTVANPNSEPVVIDFATKDGTALGTPTGGPPDGTGDYRVTSGTLTIGAQSTKGSIVIRVTADAVPDGPADINNPNGTLRDETFFVNITPRGRIPNAKIIDGEGKGTIIDDDRPTAVQLSQFRADPVDQGVELRWQFGGAEKVDRVTVERGATAAGPWIAVAGERRTDGDATVLVDRSAEAGKTYYYRLQAVTAEGRVTTFGPFTGTAGVGVTEFALSSIFPNPSRGETNFAFAMPRQADVRLSLLDVQGREVAVLAEGTYPAGRHTVKWSAQTRKAQAGIYFARFTTPVGTFVRRVAVMP